MARHFYIAHLIDSASALVVGLPGAILATEEVWSPPTPGPDYDPAIHFTPAAAADDAVAFFDTDDHGVDLDKDDLEIAIFGPSPKASRSPSFRSLATTTAIRRPI